MASVTPATPASMRQVRDKYLNMLLTGGTSAPAAPATTPSGWTPGQGFGFNHHWTSPVTPAPSENDVRLAELTAGLVAAGGVEARQTDTIRRLAEQLKNSEKRIRTLEASATRRRPSHHHASSKSDIKRTSPHSTSRKARYSTSRAAQEEENLPRSASRSSKRRGISRNEQVVDTDMVEELHTLRKQRGEWERARKRSEVEAASLSQMMADIKQNTKRLVEEREDQRKVILNLQNELAATKRWSRSSDEGPHELSEVPLRSNDAHRSENIINPVGLFDEEQETSQPSVRQLDFESEMEGEFDDEHPDFETPTQEDHARIESDLREELRLVLIENEKLSERVPQLEAECLDLSRKLRNAEKDLQQVVKQEEQRAKDEVMLCRENMAEPRTEPLTDVLSQLVDEVQILEGVSDAINFRVNPNEVEELQATMTGLTITEEQGVHSGAMKSTLRKLAPDPHGEKSTLQVIVEKVARVRESLSMRYGQWLKAVAESETTSDETILSLQRENDESMSSVDTEMINKLVSSSEN